MKKRLLSLALALCMVLTLLPTTALAALNGVAGAPITVEVDGIYSPTDNTIASGGTEAQGATLQEALEAAVGVDYISSVENLKIMAGIMTETDWQFMKRLTKLRHFEIAGAVTVADMPDTTGNPPIFPGNIISVNIPQAISIGKYAFYDRGTLTTVILPEVTAIGENAFLYCSKLVVAILPEATTIGRLAFAGCTGLMTVSLPEATVIGDRVFASCTSLKTVSLPQVTEIGKNAFSQCDVLATLELGAVPPAVGEDAFSSINFTKTNPLVLLDADGSKLTGSKRISAQNAYKADDDGDDSDGLWYGWTVGAEQFDLSPGGIYYFDLSGETANIGTVNPALPDTTLHYVPFTYAGTVNAYSRTNSLMTTEEYANANKSDRSLFVGDYVLGTSSTSSSLSTKKLIFGKTFDTNYQLRSLSVGGSEVDGKGFPYTNEWDQILDKSGSEDNATGWIKNWDGKYSFGQDSATGGSSLRAVRGAFGARG